jgi:two-component system response regulator AtoC
MTLEIPHDIENPVTTRASELAEGLFVAGLGQAMRALEVAMAELARSETPVLLLGESGVGKEAAARRIHQLSKHAEEPFRSLACSALTPDALRSVSLGLKSGTLYLEELSDLNSGCQAALLEFLPAMRGEGAASSVRPRLICGSSKDLEAEVKAGRLREDCYYRTSGVCLRLPPLRQRREDIPQLMRFFLEQYARDFRRPIPTLSIETERLLRNYDWPGNLRELEDAARGLVALGDEALAMGGLRQRWVQGIHQENGARVSLKQVAKEASRAAEKELILRALDRTRWNRRRAAKELQISYKALLYKLKQIGQGDFGA